MLEIGTVLFLLLTKIANLCAGFSNTYILWNPTNPDPWKNQRFFSSYPPEKLSPRLWRLRGFFLLLLQSFIKFCRIAQDWTWFSPGAGSFSAFCAFCQWKHQLPFRWYLRFQGLLNLVACRQIPLPLRFPIQRNSLHERCDKTWMRVGIHSVKKTFFLLSAAIRYSNVGA